MLFPPKHNLCLGSETHTDGPGGHNTKAVQDTPPPWRGTHTTQRTKRTAALCLLDVDREVSCCVVSVNDIMLLYRHRTGTV